MVQGQSEKRHEWTRTRFRNFFFKMCGNYDLVRFWLRVPASGMSLRIFKEVFVDGDQETSTGGQYRRIKKDVSTEIKMNRAVQAVRYALRNGETEFFRH